MEHIALEVFDLTGGGSKFMNLPDDTSITIVETSELFDSGDIWSFGFKINIPANAHIFGTSGEIHGSRIHDLIDKRRARMWLMGLPVYLGYLKLDDEVDVDADGNVDISFESGRKTFHEMIDGIKANQVPIPDDILIGMALDRERTVRRSGVTIMASSPQIDFTWEHGLGWDNEILISQEGYPTQMFPKYVVTDGEWTEQGSENILSIAKNQTVNTDIPSDAHHHYCNLRICYQLYGLKKNSDGDSFEKEAKRKYKISEPDRVNPAPCFFVESWIKFLMAHLGITITQNQTENIEDFLRLFFVNTKCEYMVKGHSKYTALNQYGQDKYLPLGPMSPFVPATNEDNPSWELEETIVSGFNQGLRSVQQEQLTIKNVGSGEESITWQPAYATSKNLPEKDISEVIESIESGFGVRFIFNADYTKVRIVLLRDVLSSQEVHEVTCEVLEVTKRDNSIRGFRLTYGAGEQDTNYYYQGFEAIRQKQNGGWVVDGDGHDYSLWNMGLHYADIINKVGVLNKTCYVDDKTGNAYIFKIDENFKNASQEAYPSLFSCGQFMDAEDGDCTGEDETIKEVRIGFTPMPSNRMDDGGYAFFVNEEMEVPFGMSLSASSTTARSSARSSTVNIPGREALIIDDANCSNTKQSDKAYYLEGLFELATATKVKAQSADGEERYIIPLPPVPGGRAIDQTHTIKIHGWIRDGYRLYLSDNYKPDDELTCPLEKPDWGLMLGILRGSGSGGYAQSVQYTEDLTDGEGNDTWDFKAGAIANAHADTCDDYGNLWDYRPHQAVNGNTYGDYLISQKGGNPDNIRGKKGPLPSELGVKTIIDSYPTTGRETELFVATTQGYYFIDFSLTCRDGNVYVLWLCCVYNDNLQDYSFIENYLHKLQWGVIGTEVESMRAADLAEVLSRDEYGLVVFATPTAISYTVLQEACECYLQGNNGSYIMPVDTQTNLTGKISLELRAEKPNPFFDKTRPESDSNRRYLEITTPELRHRGLMDKLHREESYWWRNAKIAVMKCQMGIAELRSIDKTVRQHIGDVTGFVKKLQYTIHIQDGLGPVTAEMWYL